MAGARGQLEACLTRVEGVRSDHGLKRQLCADLREAQTNMVDQKTFHDKGSKKMWAMGKAHMEQRSACLSDDEDEEGASSGFSYANRAQKAMRSKAKGGSGW
mmetsp:Transcript_36783/g.73721  ORF Transcript_36783/g.73721 Transcript_36783/m.73721 type:complete len:102 (+) Transcript_36783:3-308(+)